MVSVQDLKQENIVAASDEGINLQDWVGRTQTVTDLIAPFPVAALEASLDRDGPAPKMGDVLPPLYHWLYFLGTAATEALDVDGHPKRGDFLPPVTLPRRMWASSDIRFEGDLHIGDMVSQTSTIESIAETGRTGPLVFVNLRHEVTGPSGLCVVDRQTVVYREMPPKDASTPPAKPAPTDEAFHRVVSPSAALLFRYSALIFNAHRIHYDHPYTTEVEGYPGLVVHGPLLATLLSDLVRRNTGDRGLAAFQFRAMSPVFDDADFTVCGRSDGDKDMQLWAKNAGGGLCVQAQASLK
jgi:3-methylfumaryl-CoA hydratase